MRKFSIVAAAAALLALPGVAQAKVPLVNLGDLCDSLAIVVDHARVSGFPAWGGCQIGNYAGVIAKVKGTEGRSIVGSIEMLNPEGKHTQYLLQISYPLVDGGSWMLYYTKSGYRLRRYQSGTYTVVK